jgi:hypothetical protein
MYGNQTIPVKVANLTDVAQVTAYGSHSLAVRTDGTVWGWGSNSYGQLGDGTTYQRSLPVQVPGLTGVVDVRTGWDCTIALKSDGTIWAWGANSVGQLGNGTTDASLTPVQVNIPANVIRIESGWAHNLALRSDGMVWGWGQNTSGQLGHPAPGFFTEPVQIANLPFIVDIAAGSGYSLFLGEALPDTIPLAVAGVWPSDGPCAPGVRFAVVSFSEPVANVSADDLILSAGSVVSVVGQGEGPYLFKLAGMPLGSTITAYLDGDIEDLAGNSLEAYQWTWANCSCSDVDADGACDDVDNCLWLGNPDQLDSDGDGLGDLCDACPVLYSAWPVNDSGCPIIVRTDFDQDGDVDQEDFGHMQACLSGPGMAQEDSNCQNAKFDDDIDVDAEDLAILIRCLTASNVVADPDCAD